MTIGCFASCFPSAGWILLTNDQGEALGLRRVSEPVPAVEDHWHTRAMISLRLARMMSFDMIGYKGNTMDILISLWFGKTRIVASRRALIRKKTWKTTLKKHVFLHLALPHGKSLCSRHIPALVSS